MTTRVKVSEQGARLFNSIAIRFAAEALSGRLDGRCSEPGYRQLLDAFQAHHIHFKVEGSGDAARWDAFKQWLRYFNHPLDIELILAPVLFKLYRQQETQLEDKILNELSSLIFHTKNSIRKSDQSSVFIFMQEALNERTYPILQGGWRSFKEEKIFSDLRSLLAKNPSLMACANPSAVKALLPECAHHILIYLKHDRSSGTAETNAWRQFNNDNGVASLEQALGFAVVKNGNANTANASQFTVQLNTQDAQWDVELDEADFDLINAESSKREWPDKLDLVFRGTKLQLAPAPAVISAVTPPVVSDEPPAVSSPASTPIASQQTPTDAVKVTSILPMVITAPAEVPAPVVTTDTPPPVASQRLEALPDIDQAPKGNAEMGASQHQPQPTPYSVPPVQQLDALREDRKRVEAPKTGSSEKVKLQVAQDRKAPPQRVREQPPIIQEITQAIQQLEKELAKKTVMNRARKTTKHAGLTQLRTDLDGAESSSYAGIVKNIETNYPGISKGIFSKRTRQLLSKVKKMDPTINKPSSRGRSK